uniref:Calponin-homology (CH) domain-containing protein n=1 Tax=Denticeps clupeoides TaxID=299321 RepID=A0AAY4B6L3_9TELE
YLPCPVEQEQIQKRTFTNWINAQLSKRKPPCVVRDLFYDFRDGSRLLDLLEVMSGQRMSREKGRGMFQHRSNIETALSFLKTKSIKLVNINVPDIIDGKPSIILGLIWTIILQFHVSFHTLLDTRSSCSSARSSPLPPRGSPLHARFRISAKKALLLWVREQVGCSLNVKDFKASWRSGVVFLAILQALRPDVADLTKARTQSNRQNLEEAFRIAERELHIPRLLDPADVDVREPDEKSIMTYVAQFLQYSQDLPMSEEDMQVGLNFFNEISEVTFLIVSHTHRGLTVFQTFVVSFNEQRRPVMPLLTAMKRTPRLSEEQKRLRLREYKTELDLSLPSPLDTVGRWLLRVEAELTDDEAEREDHVHAAAEAREKLEQLKVLLANYIYYVILVSAFALDIGILISLLMSYRFALSRCLII